MDDTNAESQKKLSKTQPQNLAQPSVPVAVRRLIQNDEKFSDDWQKSAMILLAMYMGMSGNMLSSDAMELSVFRAKDILEEFGFPEDEINDKINTLLKYWQLAKKQNPANCLFE